MQLTLNDKCRFSGVGLHSGKPAQVTVRPARAGHGIVFTRTDLNELAPPRRHIPARWDLVVTSPLCTMLDNGCGATVSTVEHLMAALAGSGIDNALIEVDGPEIPILDGSAAPFIAGFASVGVCTQRTAKRAIRILREVEYRHGSSVARLVPSALPQLDFEIDFSDAAIGRQSRSVSLTGSTFQDELMDSRTFCRRADVDAMRASGRALGGNYLNAVVVDGDQVLSPGGMRHADEPVRHKLLDAVGDLALAGAPILGRYIGIRAGHAVTNGLLRSLFATPEAYAVETLTSTIAVRLPHLGRAIAWPQAASARRAASARAGRVGQQQKVAHA